jgi:hypothetical protein
MERFIDSLGFEAVLSEKGTIAYSPDVPLDESCYREVRNSDVFVLVIGGRYGSERSGTDRAAAKAFFDRYDSVTKLEYKAAVERDIPVYVFIERAVYAEYQTFILNKTNQKIAYAHVDSINVFHLIDEILAQPRNNPVHEFDRYEDIEGWLREQWAGLFKELLQKATERKQIEDLKTQVEDLTAISNALKNYLQEVVQKLLPQQATNLIRVEESKLAQARLEIAIRRNPFTTWLNTSYKIDPKNALDKIKQASSFESLAETLSVSLATEARERLTRVIVTNREAQKDANEVRILLGEAELPLTARSLPAAAPRRKPQPSPQPLPEASMPPPNAPRRQDRRTEARSSRKHPASRAKKGD